MTQEDKKLLLRDLCSRLPCGVKIHLEDFPNATLIGVVNEGIILHCDKYNYTYDTSWNIEYIKPYLFPLSSMTEEQIEKLKEELCNMYDPYHDYESYENWGVEVFKKHIHSDNYKFTFTADMVDWLNKNHFDYRGLIPMGLAIDATNLNIY